MMIEYEALKKCGTCERRLENDCEFDSECISNGCKNYSVMPPFKNIPLDEIDVEYDLLWKKWRYKFDVENFDYDFYYDYIYKELNQWARRKLLIKRMEEIPNEEE